MSSSPPPSAEAFASSVQTIYALPDTYYRLAETIQDPNRSLDEIADVIGSDQALAMRVLQLANSAFFSFPARVETITHALTLIGVHQVRDLIHGTAVMGMFEGVPVEHVTVRGFWEHSIACGLAAKTLAMQRHEPNVERFFVLGLLHDVGRMVLFHQHPDFSSEILEEAASDKRLLHDLEKERMGYTHADITAALMSKWQFPERLALGVKYHHSYSIMEKYPLENSCTHMADVIAHIMMVGGSGQPVIPPPQRNAWQAMHIEPDRLLPIIKQIERQLAEVLAVMLSDGP